MSHFKVNPKDIFFILKEQLNYGSLCSLPRYKDLDEKALDLLVNEAIRFAVGKVAPLQDIGEEWGVRFENGMVSCPPAFKTVFKQYGRDGWTAAARNMEYGGQGFPHMMRIVINDLMYGACQSFNMAPSLTHGAAHLIETFGSTDQKQWILPTPLSKRDTEFPTKAFSGYRSMGVPVGERATRYISAGFSSKNSILNNDLPLNWVRFPISLQGRNETRIGRTCAVLGRRKP